MAAFMCLVNGIFKEKIGAGIETGKDMKTSYQASYGLR
jgi:hypothetical protein